MNNGRCEFLPKSRPGSSLTDTNEGTKSFSAPIMRAHNVKRLAIGPSFTLSQLSFLEQDINGIFILIGPRSPRFITKVANKGEYIEVCHNDLQNVKTGHYHSMWRVIPTRKDTSRRDSRDDTPSNSNSFLKRGRDRVLSQRG